jgi:hypothetical protein
METTNYRLKVVFLTPVLGTQSSDSKIARYLAERSGVTLPDDEDDGPAEAERCTCFYRNTHDEPVLLDYQIIGFLKEAAQVLNGKVAGGVKNLRSKVENTVFVTPREVRLTTPPGGTVDMFDRPLRITTPYGKRVILASSEMLPEDTLFSCGLAVVPGDITKRVLEDLLDYGLYKGFCQWRNGGYGRFRYQLICED